MFGTLSWPPRVFMAYACPSHGRAVFEDLGPEIGLIHPESPGGCPAVRTVRHTTRCDPPTDRLQ